VSVILHPTDSTSPMTKVGSMFRKAVFPGRYIQGAGAIGELPAVMDGLGERGLVLASRSVID
jgi:hypothetical protein